MKKTILLLLCCLSVAASAQKYYSTAIHWTDNQNGLKMLQKDNGNYLIVGGAKNYVTNKWRLFALETDTLSSILSLIDVTPDIWQDGGNLRDLVKTPNGYVASGLVKFIDPGPCDIIVTKLQNDSTFENYTYGDGIDGPLNNFAAACTLTSDSVLSLGGATTRPAIDAEDLYVLKINPTTGEQLWDTIYYFNQHTVSVIKDIAATPDGGAYLAATINDNGENSDIAIIKIDSLGVWQWDTLINLTSLVWLSTDNAYSIIATKDGGAVFSAAPYHTIASFLGGPLYKIRANHSLEWVNTEHFRESGAIAITELSDSTLVFAGCSYASADAPYIDAEITKLDKHGNTMWKRIYGGSYPDYFYDCIVNNHDPTGKSGYVLCGRAESFELGVPPGKAYLYLVKTNCMGLLTEPQANFTAQMDTATLTATFQNLSQFVYPDSIDGGHYIWDFGDGATSTEINPTHTYAQGGNYSVTLTAVVCNDVSLYSQVICTDSPSFAPLFSYQTNSLTATFINQSTGVIPNQGTFSWSFGDGATSVEQNPMHTYAQSGSYTVELQAIVCQDTLIFRQTVVVVATGLASVVKKMWTISPNPADTQLTINSVKPLSGTFVLYDVLGREVLRQVMTNKQTNIAVAHLPNGLYYCKIGQTVNKLLIAH